MSIQSEFIKFHDKIKLDYDLNSELKEKREILIRILRNSNRIPEFEVLNQGSYAMHLGTEPLKGKEYDIDVGLRFNTCISDYEPMDLKNEIQDILKNHTEYGASIKKPCVTVTYIKAGEAAYHVDLVVYMYEDKNDHNSQMYLARGKEGIPDEIKWEKADPKGLVDYIKDNVSEGEREQFRRIIRYIKRWKNIKFDSTGHAEPPSIAITLMVADDFVLCDNDDLGALLYVVNGIKNSFSCVGKSDKGKELFRIELPMPAELNFEEDTDVFIKMTDSQMTDFKDKIDKLVKDLEAVQNEADEVEQCKKLNKIFGDDFNVPEAKNVSKQQKNYIPSSSASGVALWKWKQ